MEKLSIEETVNIEEDLESPSNAFLHRHRCCFHLPCFGSSSSSSTRHITLGAPTTSPSLSTSSFWDRFRTAEAQNRWWARPIWAFKKVREWSEIVAGPKWKTFIRRFNRRRHNHHHHHHNRYANQFQYDPLSYALNFDEGPGQNGHLDEDAALNFPDFSSRLAAAPLHSPSAVKMSVDLGNGAPAC